MNNPDNQNIQPLTVEEFFAIYGEKNERYELIDGIAYMMAAGNTDHQAISMFLSVELSNLLKGKKCRVFAAPYDVFLNESPRDENGKFKKNKRVKGTVVQPDLMVICDKDKIQSDGCHGAPDFIIEIASLSNKENTDRDYFHKLHKYMTSGVKEYWIINPDSKLILKYVFTEDKKIKSAEIFTFDDKIKISFSDNFEIDFSECRLSF
ncbi:MAG: Uma2 family endonuclease [Oscillospiraceae bacterium]|nr:Uma2 family endonuclease [Oscillospiraceae bacterium]